MNGPCEHLADTWTPRNVLRTPEPRGEARPGCTPPKEAAILPLLMRALAPFPEARAAVARMFAELSGGPDAVEPVWSG